MFVTLQIHERHNYMKTPKIEFVNAGDSRIEDLQTLTREAEVFYANTALRVFCANNKWYVEIFIEGKGKRITWLDFTLIFADFQQFIIEESETLLEEAVKKGGNDSE